MNHQYFHSEFSKKIWDLKYRNLELGMEPDRTVEDTWRRVAHAIAGVETFDPIGWEHRFYSILEEFRFLPGGRILAGAGTIKQVTLFNCFVMDTIEDSLAGIFDALKDGAITMQHGGGVGYDFSTLRPKGDLARRVGKVASGPVSFMHLWDRMCTTILSTGNRRGAMMATLRCDHPDIEEFIDAKRDPVDLRHFNLSVLVSDAFMRAIEMDEEWSLVFPVRVSGVAEGEYIEKVWSGSTSPVSCKIVRKLKARELWGKIMRSTYDYAEPGVIFIDRINKLNNLHYCENISATNPCGEIPLPPSGACDLGSINLTAFVKSPFSSGAILDMEGICKTASIATRMLDNVYDLSLFPLPKQAAAATGSRRLGMGITGLADALIMLGIPYESEPALQLAASVMRQICHSAYRTSILLAKEKGRFPLFEADAYLSGEFINTLPEDIKQDIHQFGIRNSHLIAIAPTGTISLLANNVSSGLEPVYEFSCMRRVRNPDGSFMVVKVNDLAFAKYRQLFGDVPLTPAFVRAADIPPHRHIAMQAALQTYVDNAISKTINVPEEFSFESFQAIYQDAYSMGLKGCTTFRPNAITGQVLFTDDMPRDEKQCCMPHRH
ncbi:adenosylcobalamin-dependent ribonucleoside-diphosphate reductase [Sulfurirhabdus autotrophica]|uniref:Vitamin B12-dependent ribonucleotide reductase n=1 Tax=Sulfurirhabdus autotrophica TaxID=1706046 RepID=A0A4R3YE17_9PROT|nr:adenosylcobalamin-dependent ribonucleoside-diphosphate reductase [Sulfurirhabdus autotrophica]TCV90765.1 ribonucleoside-diphosphate reductase class II [Sulfurirhabdus autotrophica]